MQYTLIRSKRKTLAIQIDKNAEIIVRSPMRFPIEKIEKFLQEKSDWITKTQTKIQEENLYNPPKNYTETEIREMKKILKNYIVPKIAEIW